MYVKNGHLYIIDSLGGGNKRPYDKIMFKIIDKNKLEYSFFPYSFQYADNALCGYFAIYCSKLINENKNKNPYKLVKDVFGTFADDGDIKELIRKFGMDGNQIDKMYDTEYQGAGIITDLINRFKAFKKVFFEGKTRDNLKPQVRGILKQYGDINITDIKIVRNPISLNTFFKIASKVIKTINLTHDKLFHLFIIVRVNNIYFRIEKNEDINISVYKPHKLDEVINVDMNNQILTMNKIMENTHKMMGDKMYQYSAINNNCQIFIMMLLQANKLWNETQKKFVFQDVNNMIPKWLENVMQYATDTKNKINMLTEGYGLQQIKK